MHVVVLLLIVLAGAIAGRPAAAEFAPSPAVVDFGHHGRVHVRLRLAILAKQMASPQRITESVTLQSVTWGDDLVFRRRFVSTERMPVGEVFTLPDQLQSVLCADPDIREMLDMGAAFMDTFEMAGGTTLTSPTTGMTCR